jgi:hypothetical protein
MIYKLPWSSCLTCASHYGRGPFMITHYNFLSTNRVLILQRERDLVPFRTCTFRRCSMWLSLSLSVTRRPPRNETIDNHEIPADSPPGSGASSRFSHSHPRWNRASVVCSCPWRYLCNSIELVRCNASQLTRLACQRGHDDDSLLNSLPSHTHVKTICI